MKNQLFNYLSDTWIIRKLKRYGLMNRTAQESLRESEIHRVIKEYNLIQRNESKMNRKSRDLIVKSVEQYAKDGIITIAPIKVKPVKTVMDVV